MSKNEIFNCYFGIYYIDILFQSEGLVVKE